MLRAGLTGGMACGKSTVAQMFARRGARVVHADAIARELMQPGKPVYNAVVRHFGREIVQPDGAINRPKLAEIAFGQNRVQELNRLVHPAVVREQEAWMERLAREDPEAVAIVEAALILEAGVGGGFDKLIVVTCRPEQKIERYAARCGNRESARAEAARRIAAQMSDEEKIRAADYVIDNSGPLAATERQVDTVYSELQRAAAPGTGRPAR